MSVGCQLSNLSFFGSHSPVQSCLILHLTYDQITWTNVASATDLHAVLNCYQMKAVGSICEWYGSKRLPVRRHWCHSRNTTLFRYDFYVPGKYCSSVAYFKHAALLARSASVGSRCSQMYWWLPRPLRRIWRPTSTFFDLYASIYDNWTMNEKVQQLTENEWQQRRWLLFPKWISQLTHLCLTEVQWTPTLCLSGPNPPALALIFSTQPSLALELVAHCVSNDVSKAVVSCTWLHAIGLGYRVAELRQCEVRKLEQWQRSFLSPSVTCRMEM